MKREKTSVAGVFKYDNGMIGTADLPEMLKTFRGRQHHSQHKFMPANVHVKPRLSMRDQLAKLN